MIQLIFQTIIYFLPAGFANMAPVLFKKINFLNKPINKKWFGNHKTYRGFFFGILLGMITSTALMLPLYFGLLSGIGALTGDLVKSYFKRKQKIKPGTSWPPFDQIDWIVGTSVFTVYFLELHVFLLGLILFGLLHIIINYLGYLLKIKNSKF